MKPLVITLDCAQTMVEVNWSPEGSVAECAIELPVELPPGATATFSEMFLADDQPYRAANLEGDQDRLTNYWVDLHRRWLRSCGLDESLATQFVARANELTYGDRAEWFHAYPDVVPGLERLTQAGYRLAVLSNWDISLLPILKRLKLDSFFEAIFPSLEYGVEKPDPAFFHLVFSRLGVRPEQVLHVGDHLDDDIEGARRAGCRSILIDRNGKHPSKRSIGSFDELPEAFDWNN